MRIGYLTSETSCNLTDYNSFLRCPDGNNLRTQLFNLLERIVPKENIEFISFKKYSSPGNWSLNNETLMGSLVNGMIDSVTYNLILSIERAEYLSFSTPYTYQKTCFYTKRPQRTTAVDNSLYFMAPFSNNVWILVILSVFVVFTLNILFQKISQIQRTPHYNLPNFLLEMLVSSILNIYVSTLRESFSESGIQVQPFRTVNELAELVKSRSQSIISVDKNEFMFSGKDFAPLREALSVNPIIGTSDVTLNVSGHGNKISRICELLPENPKFILLESQRNVFKFCDYQSLRNIIEICLENMLPIMSGGAFKRKSKEVERISRLAGVLYPESLNREKQRQYEMSLMENVVQTISITMSSIKYILVMFAVGNFTAIIIFFFESVHEVK